MDCQLGHVGPTSGWLCAVLLMSYLGRAVSHRTAHTGSHPGSLQQQGQFLASLSCMRVLVQHAAWHKRDNILAGAGLATDTAVNMG